VFGRADILSPAAAIALAALALPAATAAAECRGRDDAGAVVCEVNRVRDARGLDALRQDGRLERAAESHARDMVRRGYFSHVTPEGETVSDRLRDAGYLGSRAPWRVGEALAWGRRRLSTPAATVRAWMESPPHRRVLLNGRYREIGVGVADGVPSGGAGTTFAAELGVVGV
jgi:uncharacterized protein YkwD